MSRKPMPLLIASLLMLAACVTTPKTATVPITPGADAIPCAALAPISFSAIHDTAATVNEVRQFNAKFNAICKETK